ncbi:hypothetical protein I6I98_04630 [Sphingobacterium multivorum]|uniref:Uncharacterized protein n=1 Tax=Sphingobacterium multivorum TaxID=28454 RepID=A0ABX7CWJ2_SPHMU|nr:hypothetical protein [Sphingobacterium multivorum]QQT54547.1 hypothetical protein I6I98_04630 [Sphingobacterium multivorum]
MITNQFLIKNTMADMRNLSACEIVALESGCYSGVELLGYYEKGDTPYPVQYIVSQESLVDDGGSFIISGTIKLMVMEQDLDLRHFGAIDDGDEVSFTGTDNKQQIVHFINYVSRSRTTGYINGKYSTSAFRIDVDNVSLMLSSGSYLLGRTDMGLNEKLVGIGADTVHINAYGAFFQAPVKTTGQDNHIIQIDTGKNVTIEGLKAIGGGGDGFYIGSTSTNRPTNISLIDVKTDNARRNGISCINGINLKLIRPVCEGAKGTYPMAGIDIEPNSKTEERIEGLYIDSPITRDNNGYGVLVTLGTYIKEAEKNVDITIVNHTSIRDGQDGTRGGLGIVGTGHTYDWPYKCNGIVRYSGQVFLPGGPGLVYHSQNPAYAPLYEVDIYIQDCGTKQNAANYFKSAVLVYGGVGTVNFPNGNLTLNAKIRDTRATALTFTDIYIYNPSQEIENVTMYVDADNRTTFGSPLVCNAAHNFKGNITFKDMPLEVGTTTAATSTVNYFGTDLSLKNNIGFTLPLSLQYIGQEFNISNGDIAYKNIKLSIGDKWDNVNSANTQDIILNVKQRIKLRATAHGWLLVDTNDTIRYFFTNTVRPPQISYLSAVPSDGTWVKGDIVYNLNVVDGQSIGWQCQVGGTPGTWKPFGTVNMNKANSSADTATAPGATYTQSEVQGILMELRDLKSKLKIAGILAI